jgi:hypothetical protein
MPIIVPVILVVRIRIGPGRPPCPPNEPQVKKKTRVLQSRRHRPTTEHVTERRPPGPSRPPKQNTHARTQVTQPRTRRVWFCGCAVVAWWSAVRLVVACGLCLWFFCGFSARFFKMLMPTPGSRRRGPVLHSHGSSHSLPLMRCASRHGLFGLEGGAGQRG